MFLVFTAFIISLCSATSLIDVTTFTDNDCTVLSATSPNVSLPLDACITTIGMESLQYHPTPCAGGGSTTVQIYAYSDAHCLKTWHDAVGMAGCYYAYYEGSAFGSIMLTCKAASSNPKPDGTSITIDVGPVASDSPSGSSTTASGSNSTSNGSDQNPPSSPTGNDSGWNSLSLGEKIGIVVALLVGIPPIVIGIKALREGRKRKQAAQSEEYGLSQYEQPRSAMEQQTMHTWYPQTPPSMYSPHHFTTYDGKGYGGPWARG